MFDEGQLKAFVNEVFLESFIQFPDATLTPAFPDISV
jgi:hypothetical protein